MKENYNQNPTCELASQNNLPNFRLSIIHNGGEYISHGTSPSDIIKIGDRVVKIPAIEDKTRIESEARKYKEIHQYAPKSSIAEKLVQHEYYPQTGMIVMENAGESFADIYNPDKTTDQEAVTKFREILDFEKNEWFEKTSTVAKLQENGTYFHPEHGIVERSSMILSEKTDTKNKFKEYYQNNPELKIGDKSLKTIDAETFAIVSKKPKNLVYTFGDTTPHNYAEKLFDPEWCGFNSLDSLARPIKQMAGKNLIANNPESLARLELIQNEANVWKDQFAEDYAWEYGGTKFEALEVIVASVIQSRIRSIALRLDKPEIVAKELELIAEDVKELKIVQGKKAMLKEFNELDDAGKSYAQIATILMQKYGITDMSQILESTMNIRSVDMTQYFNGGTTEFFELMQQNGVEYVPYTKGNRGQQIAKIQQTRLYDHLDDHTRYSNFEEHQFGVVSKEKANFVPEIFMVEGYKNFIITDDKSKEAKKIIAGVKKALESNPEYFGDRKIVILQHCVGPKKHDKIPEENLTENIFVRNIHNFMEIQQVLADLNIPMDNKMKAYMDMDTNTIKTGIIRARQAEVIYDMINK
jgi:hypothetical protein